MNLRENVDKAYKKNSMVLVVIKFVITYLSSFSALERAPDPCLTPLEVP